MNRGVEWSVHVLLSLAWLDDDKPVPTAELAASYELPVAYLNKQLQALVRAGLLRSVPGAHGGFLLARRPEEITLMDVVSAIEGREPAFQCTEIRRQGMGEDAPRSAFRRKCAVDAAMQQAEVQWRRALAAQTIADIRAEADSHAPSAGRLARKAYGRA
ncbi:RrF2 family transcriptional regulator [Amycolatopsis sp. NPDC051903]|uniref:RrF2 family transcriptional regulator n=1 Tax=Amycolatopsis sp. NPDC051903 TaxID=3363936 RepID=UPI0037A04FDB